MQVEEEGGTRKPPHLVWLFVSFYALFATVVAAVGWYSGIDVSKRREQQDHERWLAQENIPGWLCIGESVRESEEEATDPDKHFWGWRRGGEGSLLMAKPFAREDCPDMIRRGVKWIVYAKIGGKDSLSDWQQGVKSVINSAQQFREAAAKGGGEPQYMPPALDDRELEIYAQHRAALEKLVAKRFCACPGGQCGCEAPCQCVVYGRGK